MAFSDAHGDSDVGFSEDFLNLQSIWFFEVTLQTCDGTDGLFLRVGEFLLLKQNHGLYQEEVSSAVQDGDVVDVFAHCCYEGVSIFNKLSDLGLLLWVRRIQCFRFEDHQIEHVEAKVDMRRLFLQALDRCLTTLHDSFAGGFELVRFQQALGLKVLVQREGIQRVRRPVICFRQVSECNLSD